jgi:hypothetical protein
MKNITLLICIVVACSSCATIFTGTRDTIQFNSNPSGAVIYRDGLEICKTPCSFPIKRSINDPLIEMKLDGYQTRVFTLDKSFNVVSILNVGNLLGWGIDILTGSIMRYDRKTYSLDLTIDKKLNALQPQKIMIDTKNNTVDLYTTVN